MDNKLKKVLNDRDECRVVPFFWIKNESGGTFGSQIDFDKKSMHDRIREVIAKIDEAGIKGICVESRPHSGFAGEEWFRDFDLIMDEAKKRGMKVWLLDDRRFPTGYCNGAVKDKYPQSRKEFISRRYIDVAGPRKGMKFSIVNIMNMQAKFIGAVASNGDARQVLTAIGPDGKITWDVPDGVWRVNMFYAEKLAEGSKKSNPDHLNLISENAGEILIEAVYEPHYARYKDDFGTTFMGFFSDEPELGNIDGEAEFARALIGNSKILPWSEELKGKLLSKMTKWPDLWDNKTESAKEFKIEYMNAVTDLLHKNFTSKLDAWCKERGVEHIGHILEDNGVHTATGMGLGHYFKAMKGYAKSGIDVVLCQLMPGIDEVEDCKSLLFNAERNNIFYHYELAKLGSSAARIEGKESALCEVFGAYGWQEGLRLEKWLVDHMLVRGINFFVPHAFTVSDFPDTDCPPHFYAFGNNPHYPYFKRLMRYTDRLCELFSGGAADIKAAVLYPAEQEWANTRMNSNVKTEMALTRNQIDFDIVPLESVTDIKSGSFHKNGYKVLLVEQSDYMPECVKSKLAELEKNNVKVYVLSDFNREAVMEELVKGGFRCKITDTQDNYLRVMTYAHGDKNVYMLFNEHPAKAVDVKLNGYGDLVEYDALNNVLYYATDAQLTLRPYESKVFVAKAATAGMPVLSKAFGREAAVKDDAFILDAVPERAELDLGTVNETAVVKVNGKDAGVAISAPYKLILPKNVLKKGENKVEVEVITTLNHTQFDALSVNCAEEPVGWDGKFTVRY